MKAPFVWYGGKSRMVAKLRSLIPPGGYPYCEPFCGAASMLFAREPAPVEVVNDINGDIVNVFRVLQSAETAERFRYLVNVTPYARSELERAIEIWRKGTDDPVLRAWAFFVRCNMSIGGRPAKSVGDWGRVFTSTDGIAHCVNRWLMRLSMIDAWRWRLSMVQIDNRDGIEVISYWDNRKAVFYVDPPYHLGMRVESAYEHEMTDERYAELIDVLLRCEGAVTLSGYNYPLLFSRLESSGWKRFDFDVVCHAAARTRDNKLKGEGAMTKFMPRVESVWLNPRALEQINRLDG